MFKNLANPISSINGGAEDDGGPYRAIHASHRVSESSGGGERRVKENRRKAVKTPENANLHFRSKEWRVRAISAGKEEARCDCVRIGIEVEVGS